MRKLSLHIFLLLIIISTACSTKKNTTITRAYHNLTTHYNVFFNGNESFKKGVKKIEESYIDNYTSILSLFRFGDPQSAQAGKAEMERAAQKASKAITLHSLRAKPEIKSKHMTAEERKFYNQREFNKWIPDNYLLIGKTHVYQLNFEKAVETFEFMQREYDNSNILPEAEIWLARTYIQQKEYDQALKLLDNLTSDKKLKRRLYSEAMATYADLYIKQEKYNQAIPKLILAIDKSWKKSERLRYRFVLAQLYQKVKDFQRAAEMYRKVIHSSPPYEMAFSARINLATSFELGSGDPEAIRKQLNKMLRENKNKDYRDQIYYALADISLKEGKTDEGVELLKLSSQTSVTNIYQKAQSCITLADIYYQRHDYINAHAYYDTAVQVVDETYPSYARLSDKVRSLGRLVNYINTISFEDSVQKIAALTEAQRLAVIDGIIAHLKEQELADQNNENLRKQDYYYNQSRFNQNNNSNTNTQTGKWYFYNPQTMSFGMSEFQSKWGKRKLEDNWRRRNKKVVSVATEGENEDEPGEDNPNKTPSDNKSREFYLVNLPLTDSLMNLSHERIITALYNMGNIYKDELHDNDLAIKAYNEILKRYPNGEYAPAACYNLSKIYEETGNTAKSGEYKQMLLNRYPTSKFAQVISNPNYLNQLLNDEKQISILYEQAYKAFREERYDEVLANCNTARDKYKDNELYPKFEYLRTLVIGKTADVKTFREALNTFIASYPKNEVVADARNIIAYMNKQFPVIKKEEDIKIAEELYKTDDTSKCYFIIYLPTKKDVNQINFNLINFNLDNYPNVALNNSNEALNDKAQLINVRLFPNKTKALEYFDKAIAAADLLKDVDKTDIQIFVITEQHYKLLLQDKNIEKYMAFFHKEYNR